MKKRITFLFALATSFCLMGQVERPGYPDRSPDLDVLPGFQSPPPGYGEVPFYWWMGDTLTREHLTYHLDLLKDRGVSSLQVNYAHSDKGGSLWGLTIESKPKLFSEEWWELFGWFMGEAKKRGMTVSLSDYTLGIGQGACIDRALIEDPTLRGYELICEKKEFTGEVELNFNQSPLLVTVYQIDEKGQPLANSKRNITSKVKQNHLVYKTSDNQRYLLLAVYPQMKQNSYDPMHPRSGAAYVKHFFQPFEDRFPELSKGGLNFFFSDELEFQLQGNIWNDDFRKEFKKRKKYDILPYLSALYIDEGNITPKIRLDYNDVMVSLSEERFFKPVFDWHDQRGLIYGCDHGGRGKRVDEFGDYFRTQRWNQGPGCDQPLLGKDIIKNKVASSISHLYERPRVWLEGFYSSGWGTNTASLIDAIFANYAMGQNLMSLHGLYYSTVGGWWEWAPPCNHFHQPYWNESKLLLKCTERLSYLLSQGDHRADIALLYPVEPVVAGYGNKAVDAAFALGEQLYKSGLDFDFMDYESLSRSIVGNEKFSVSGEHYKVLIIPSMQVLRHSTLLKALEIKKSGGTVIFLGELPEASEQKGRNNPEIKRLIDEILTNKGGEGKGYFLLNNDQVFKTINERITPDFKILSSSTLGANPYVMHRRLGTKELYAVYNVAKESECFFRTKGVPLLLDPWTGTTRPLQVDRVTPEGVVVRMPLEATDMQLLLFEPSGVIQSGTTHTATPSQSIPLNGDWEVELVPTLDNQYGDFHWPATPRKIGAEIREIHHLRAIDSPEGWNQPSYDATKWSVDRVGFASPFVVNEGNKEPLSSEELLKSKDSKKWKPYTMSWRWGVLNDYGHQGYHGLKAEMYDDFIRLGKWNYASTEIRRESNPNGDHYYMLTYVYAPRSGQFTISMGGVHPKSLWVNGKQQSDISNTVSLEAGANELMLYYDKYCTTYFVVQEPTLVGSRLTVAESEKPLSMIWRGDLSRLPMDTSANASSLSSFYRFESAPGLRQLSFEAYATTAEVWVDGKAAQVKAVSTKEPGLLHFTVTVPELTSSVSQVAMRLSALSAGYFGGAAIPNPIQMECGKGVLSLGDWTQNEGLRCYSGGMTYRKKINIPNSGSKYILDLGVVSSTARVTINGKEVGVKLSPPYRFDVSNFLQSGENCIEVFICNTAGNHYLTIPTQYRGHTLSGLLGPVRIESY